jgi:hypothetical protein
VPDINNETGKAGNAGAGGLTTTSPGPASGAVAAPAQPVLRKTKGPRHVSPPGRHSQQTHRRAKERAAVDGHATEREQHDHDRSTVLGALSAEATRVAKQKSSQTMRSGPPAEKIEEAPQQSK